MICSPSFLSSDFTQLKSEILSIDKAQWLHFDVMDGKFVSNITYDHKMLKEISSYSNQLFDCHLMIENPQNYVDDYIHSGADIVTFHYEATNQVDDLIKHIQSQGVKAGISIKPDTPVEVLKPFLPHIDLILIMSVEPGQGGQAFIPSSLAKISYLDEQRKNHQYDYKIEVDGGINYQTALKVKNAGCDVIVVGSFIFNQNHRNDVIEALENV